MIRYVYKIAKEVFTLMHKREDFEVYEVRKELVAICDDFEYPAWSNSKKEVEIVYKDIKATIDKIVRKSVNEGGFGFDKGYKVVSKFYPEEREILEYATFTISLSSDDKLEVDQYNKKTFKVEAGLEFIDNLIIELAEFFDGCFIAEKLQENLDELNEVVADILRENDPVFLESKEKGRVQLIKELNNSKEMKVLLDNRLRFETAIDASKILMWAIEEHSYKINKDGSYSSATQKDIIKQVAEYFLNYKYYNLFNASNNRENSESINRKRAGDLKHEAVGLKELLKTVTTLVEIMNTTAEEIQVAEEPSLNIRFGLGEGFLDVSDNFAVIGLSEDVVKNLSILPLFDKVIESRSQGYKEIFNNALIECKRSYDFVKVKSLVTDENNLGIYSRKALHNLFIEYAHRPVYSSKARVGISYYETDTDFAVIEKTAVSMEELKKVKEDKWIIVIDNDKMTNDEKKENKTKIKVTFKVKPYNKETNEQVDIALAEVLAYNPNSEEIAN
jgi:hypothetical protein